MRIPRVACINDLSGFGRCSLTTAIAILSASGVQACPVPTAILSKHTGFDSFYFKDLTDSLNPYMKDWQSLDFDGIYSGFLGSAKQIDAVENFIKAHKSSNNAPCVVVDPVMGDAGKLYATYTPEMQDKMKKLAMHADIVTPNITEACFLTDTPYIGEDIYPHAATELIKKLGNQIESKIVLTGIVKQDKIINMTYSGGSIELSEINREKNIYSGTGDIFSSIVCAFILKGKPLHKAVEIAGKFISMAIEQTSISNTSLTEGVVFEPLLYKLGNIL